MISTIQFLLATSSAVTARTHPVPAGQSTLDVQMLFGFIAVLATLLCFLEGRRSRKARFALGVCLLATAAYGFAQGAWPLGLLNVVWAGVVFARCWASPAASIPKPAETSPEIGVPDRRTELFGSP